VHKLNILIEEANPHAYQKGRRNQKVEELFYFTSFSIFKSLHRISKNIFLFILLKSKN